ncbi:MAG TPA: hypothetical protein VHU88_22350 [Sporichthyaceae bacterium]|jgi:hypothetical protein|nr:hypothetical protein [Sporichthyaceae bacterium]
MRARGSIVALVTTLALTGCGSSHPQSAPASTPTPDASASPSASAAPVKTPDARATPGSTSDVSAITKIVKSVAVTADYQHVVCQQLFTPDFVTTAFGGMNDCQEYQVGAGTGSHATGASVSDVKVEGDTAAGNVAVQGGSAGGSTGTWYFQRSAGTWRVADQGVNYLRSNFKLGIARQASTDSSNPFADTVYRDCFAVTVLALPDGQFRTAFFANQAGVSTLGQVVAPCDAKAPGGVSPFRALFEKEIRSALAAQQLSATTQNCAVYAMKKTISDPDLTDAILDETVPGAAADNNLQSLETVTLSTCLGGPTSSAAPQPS